MTGTYGEVMQLAMNRVNEQNREHGLPEVEMGIGINTGEAIVGNIGSQKRAKYGVVGSTVNLTGRIESYTVGGQILISEETYKATEPLLQIGQQLTVEPKGVKEHIPLYEVTGMSGEYNLFLSASQETLLLLDKPIPIRYSVLEEKFAGQTVYEGHITRLSSKEEEIHSENPLDPLSNLKIQLIDKGDTPVAGDLFGKIIDKPSANPSSLHVRFTSVSKIVAQFMDALLAHD